MNLIPTLNRNDTTKYNAVENKRWLNNKADAISTEYYQNGLTKKYDCGINNDEDWGWYPLNGYDAGNLGSREFSSDDQEILETYMTDFISKTKKDKIVIVEIGVSRNIYEFTSTSVFLQKKSDKDIYLGIDIDDKSFLNDQSRNIYTIQSPSQDMDVILEKMAQIGIYEIDILMIDGWHSINQCYMEWELYTQILAPKGMIVMHDTNFHPGPYFLVDSINTNQYDVYKHLWDVQDWGISFALRRD